MKTVCASGDNYCGFMATHALTTDDKVIVVITQRTPSLFHIYQTHFTHVRVEHSVYYG